MISFQETLEIFEGPSKTHAPRNYSAVLWRTYLRYVVLRYIYSNYSKLNSYPKQIEQQRDSSYGLVSF